MSTRAEQIRQRATLAGLRAEADELKLKTGHLSAETAKHRAEAQYLGAAVDTLCREAEFQADMRKPRPAPGNRLCLGALGSSAVALEYLPSNDDNEPVALLLTIWIEGHANSADDKDTFPPQLIARWETVVQADYEYHLSEMARDAMELLVHNAHEAPLCPIAAAAAEDQFIAARDAASYQGVSQ